MKRKAVISAILFLVLIAVIVGVVVLHISSGAEVKNQDKILVSSLNGNVAEVNESDIEKGFAQSSKQLRKDLDTVIAEVNGEKITVNDLNLKRSMLVIQSGEPLRKFTEKEVTQQLVYDYVVYDYLKQQGFVYEGSEIEASYKQNRQNDAQNGNLKDSEKYSEISGLGEEKFEELAIMIHKNSYCYPEFNYRIMDDLLADKLGLDDKRSRKIYRELNENSDIDFTLQYQYTQQLTASYIQKPAGEADVVIYEDKLN